MLMVFMLLVALATLVALVNWRWGIGAAIVLGLLQDPLRKIIPGTPAYLVLAGMPIWLGVICSAAFSRQLPINRFLSQFPRLGLWIRTFAIYLVIPAAISATYGHNSWLITLLGIFIYSTIFGIFVAGWRYPHRSEDIARLLTLYAAVTALMLMGGPLDAFKLPYLQAFVGTDMFGAIWVTHRTGEALHMLSGFFRSPDVMGWHAALLFMVATVLALRSKGVVRWLWVAVAIWGIFNIWLCGRRKMLSMIPIFLGTYTLLVFRFKNARRIFSLVGMAAMIMGLGWYVIASVVHNEALERFYVSTLAEMGERVETHGLLSVAGTIAQSGFWGYGLGMSQQGVHNIPNVETPRLWQESGPSKIVAEFGVPGMMLYLMVGVVLFITAYHVVRFGRERDSFYLTAGIFAILVANVASAVVSAQIFGDPLVAFLLAFIAGLLLSGARLAAQHAPRTEGAP